jgi:hypothetical protein
MRVVLILAALAFATTCTTANVGAETVEITTIARGSYAADDSGRKAVLATTDAEYRRLWTELIGNGENAAATVDFERGVVAFLIAGVKNSGGWSIEPGAISIDPDGTAVIQAKVAGPPPGAITTQALTTPYAVVFLNSRNVKAVHWPQ